MFINFFYFHKSIYLRKISNTNGCLLYIYTMSASDKLMYSFSIDIDSFNSFTHLSNVHESHSLFTIIIMIYLNSYLTHASLDSILANYLYISTSVFEIKNNLPIRESISWFKSLLKISIQNISPTTIHRYIKVFLKYSLYNFWYDFCVMIRVLKSHSSTIIDRWYQKSYSNYLFFIYKRMRYMSSSIYFLKQNLCWTFSYFFIL